MIRLMCGILLTICGVSNIMEIDITLKDYLLNNEKIIVYFDNKSYEYDMNNQQNLKNSINDLLIDSHEMPALGVAIDEEIRHEIKNGLWVEFVFSTTQNYNGMPFDKLLIKVNPPDMGLNIFREYNGKYDGRCFYINLNKDMSDFNKSILEIL